MPEILMHSYNKRNVEIKKNKNNTKKWFEKALQLKILASSKKNHYKENTKQKTQLGGQYCTTMKKWIWKSGRPAYLPSGKRNYCKKEKTPPTCPPYPQPYCTGPLFIEGAIMLYLTWKEPIFFLSFSIPISNIKEKTAAKSCLKNLAQNKSFLQKLLKVKA